MFKFIIPTVALALTPVAASAENPYLHLAGITITESFVQNDFDVAGVTLGMTAEVAFAQLEARGYKPQKNQMHRGPSFDDLVAVASGETQPNAIKSDWKEATFHNGDEEMYLIFKPIPNGNGVAVVSYRNTAKNMNLEKFKPLAVNKYGNPKYSDTYATIWSDMPLNSSNEADEDNNAIGLELRKYSTNGVRLELNGGKIGAVDPEKEAEVWSPPAKTTF